MKFSALDIASILTFILMSIIIFIKYLPLVRPKLVPKLKMPSVLISILISKIIL